MAKFWITWRFNLSAPWPMDPVEGEKLQEDILAAIDDFLESGKFLDFGFFPDGQGGYAISSGEAKDMFTIAGTLGYFMLFEAHEMVPYETGKEVIRELFKAQREALKR